MYDFNEKLANLAVHYALDVKPKELVSIEGSEVAKDLLCALYIECVKAGAYPVVMTRLNEIDASFYKYANEDQLKFINPLQKYVIKNFQKRIQIMADYNLKKMALIDPEKLNLYQQDPEFPELMKTYQERLANHELDWVLVPYPCDAMAQEANMDTESYREFVYKALKLDTEDPAAVWRQIQEEQDKKVKILNTVEQIHVIGEDTDITLSVKDRLWINCCGHDNLPDGEIFTSPVEDSVNGHIRFTYPGIYQGQEIENIYLEFKDGKVTKATAEKGQKLLDSILKIDRANILGEFAVGTNHGITKFTKNMLFDEKLGGTLHMALGMGFPEAKSQNLNCGIHWDILKNMESPESKIFADGKVIYEAGKWKI